MRPTILLLTLCCLVLGACSKSAQRAAAPVEPVATAEATGPATDVAAPKPAPVVEPPKPTRSRRDAAVATSPVVTPQPPAPPLPAVVDRSTTTEQLAAHALVVAREEVAAEMTNGYGVLDRQAFLLAAWTPQMQARQSELAAIAQTREARSQKQVSTAQRLATNEARLRTMEAEYERKAAVEQAKTAPILPQ